MMICRNLDQRLLGELLVAEAEEWAAIKASRKGAPVRGCPQGPSDGQANNSSFDGDGFA